MAIISQTVDKNSDQYYYDNPSEWGKSQYVSLKNIIDNILLGADDDSHFKHTKRFRAVILGKQAVKKMNVDVEQKYKTISIELSPSKIFPFPRFMTNWSRVSVLNECGKLEELKINTSNSIQDYLQDDTYELLYDESGEILRANDFNAERGHCRLEFQCKDKNYKDPCGGKSFKKSWVKANKAGNYFEFSDDLVDEIIVFEFQTANLENADECDVMIHNDLELTVTRFIQWNLLLGKRNVPKQDYITFKNEYKIEKRRSQMFLGKKISIGQILDSTQKRYN